MELLPNCVDNVKVAMASYMFFRLRSRKNESARCKGKRNAVHASKTKTKAEEYLQSYILLQAFPSYIHKEAKVLGANESETLSEELSPKKIYILFCHQESEVARGYWFLFPSYNKRNESAGRKRERNAACDPSLVFRRETKALDANESGTVSCMGKEIVTFNHLAIGPFLWNCDGLAFNIRPCLIASWTCKTQSPATTSWQTGKARYRFRSSRTQLKHLCFELPLNLTVARPLAWGLNHWLQRLQPNASHHTWEEKKLKFGFVKTKNSQVLG